MDTGAAPQLNETATFIAAPMKTKHIYLAVYFAKGYFFVNLLREKLWV